MLMRLLGRFTIAGALAVALVPAHALARPGGEQRPGVERQQPRTLRQQLAALESAHEITILLHPAIRVNTPMVERVDLADPEPALRALLRGYDFFLQYGASE